jgi:8-oxo-dGTP pyrophosphatase MutT (NUDIX family)
VIHTQNTEQDDLPIRPAATVLLLRDRDNGGGIEAWLLNRVSKMAFAAGMTVFPGGRVEPSDEHLPWHGPAPFTIAKAFGCSVERATALIGAAARETFEETGVLLTSPTADLSFAQPDVEAGRTQFGDLLRQYDLRVEESAFRPWAHWITPKGETRRYDTFFFIATLPVGSFAANVSTESSSAGWVLIEAALAERERGVRQMMPPTVSVLGAVARFETVADVLDAAQNVAVPTIEPVLRTSAGRKVAQLPDGTEIAVSTPASNRTSEPHVWT